MAEQTAPEPGQLSRRERQIMDVLYAVQEATAAQVHAALPDAPSYSAVRALLRKLLEKGHVNYRADGPRYVYWPRVGKTEAQAGAVRRLLNIFFNGNAVAAVTNLLGGEEQKLSAAEIRELEDLVTRLKANQADD